MPHTAVSYPALHWLFLRAVCINNNNSLRQSVLLKAFIFLIFIFIISFWFNLLYYFHFIYMIYCFLLNQLDENHKQSARIIQFKATSNPPRHYLPSWDRPVSIWRVEKEMGWVRLSWRHLSQARRTQVCHHGRTRRTCAPEISRLTQTDHYQPIDLPILSLEKKQNKNWDTENNYQQRII